MMSKKSTIIIFLIILLFPSFINAVIDSYCASTIGVLVFNTTAWDDTNLTNVSLYGTWGGGWHLNETNYSGINNTDYIFTINFTGSDYADGTYYYKFRAYDWRKNWRDSSIGNFRIDRTSPIVNLVTPISTSISNTIIFTYNVSEVEATYCNLIINNVTVQTDTSIATYTTQTFTQTLSNGNYDWSINCVDVCYLENTSETRTLTVAYPIPTDSSANTPINQTISDLTIEPLVPPKEDKIHKDEPTFMESYWLYLFLGLMLFILVIAILSNIEE